MRRLSALVVLVALLVSACTQIPTAGPVEDVPMSQRPGSVDIAPEPPQPGVGADRLVEGFIQAMADPESNYRVAREYLTRQAALRWDPRAGTRIFDGTIAESEGSVRLSGQVSGSLDEVGRFTSQGSGLDHDFRVVDQDGEWRIDAPPEGVLLSRYNFELYYAHVSIYFISRADGWVIPDLLHIPESQLTPTRLVEAQLAGPSPMLGDTARNALATVSLDALASATIDPDGIATIDFDTFPDSLPDDRRREVGAQLMWSLTAIPRVTGLRLTVREQPWRIPGQNAAGVLEFSSQQGYQVLSRATSPDLFGVRGGRAGRVTSAEAFLPFSVSGALRGMDIDNMAVSLDGSEVALVVPDRRMILIGAPDGPWSPELPLLQRIDEVQFAVGDLWVLGQVAGRSSLIRYDGSRNPQRVDLTGIPGTVVGMSIAQAGTRVALVVRQGQRTTLGIATMRMRGVPRIVGWQPLHLGVGEDSVLPVSVDWSTESELAVLAETPGGTRTVFLTSSDGAMVEDLGPMRSSPVELTALPRLGGDSIVVRSEAGQVYRYEARTRWSEMDVELERIAYPG